MFKALIAGIAIALGGWAYLLAMDPIVGAVIFSCGLLTVRIYGLHLFTGKVQLMVTKENPWYYYPLILLSNFLGVIWITCLSYNTVHDTALALAIAKSSQPLLVAFCKGVGCGMLMSLATYKDTPLWVTPLAVAAFIIAGFNHCIADFYYMLTGGLISWPLCMTILGNIFGGIILSRYLLKDER